MVAVSRGRLLVVTEVDSNVPGFTPCTLLLSLLANKSARQRWTPDKMNNKPK